MIQLIVEGNMPRLGRRHKKKRGLPPGTLEFPDYPGMKEIAIQHLSPIDDQVSIKDYKSIHEALKEALNSPNWSWVDINGLHDIEVIKTVGSSFGIHKLLLEDILNTDHRTKVDELNTSIILLVKNPILDTSTLKINFEQISFILAKGVLVSFQEKELDIFRDKKTRLAQYISKKKSITSDYLLYLLLDTIVDNYFAAIDKVADKLDELALQDYSVDAKNKALKIAQLRMDILFLTKNLSPLKEVVEKLIASNNNDLKPENKIYFQDLSDHLIRQQTEVSSYRDVLNFVNDALKTTLQDEANKMLQKLSAFASLLLPPTLIGAIYGMNFQFMPELSWVYGYPFALGLMVLTSAFTFFYFRRKHIL